MKNILKKLFGKNKETTPNEGKQTEPTALRFDSEVKTWPLDKLKAEAENGNPHAQYLLGNYYENGYKVEQNKEEMIRLYKAAADQGLAESILQLGVKYVTGDGVPLDNDMGFHLFQQAAQMGVENAMYNIGRCYLYGVSVEKDTKTAFEWFQKAADKNFGMALETMGMGYQFGEIGEIDLDKAYQYYKKASEVGYHNGYLRARQLYEQVNGVMLVTTNEQDAIDVAMGIRQLPLPDKLRK